jgi:ATP-dependent RNA helicase RhlE
MLVMGFIHDLRRIVARVPRERQTLLFSATMPREIRSLADQWLTDPVEIQVVPQGTTVERVEQSVHFVEKKAKPKLLAQYVRDQGAKRTLVFTRTKHGADKLVKHLIEAGLRAAAIHGNKSQSARQYALAQFKSQHPPILVATDIAARGLDIDEVSHVVNFDLPMTPETYVHRIGRTGRAGAAGISVTFCDREERGMLREIERLTRQRIPVAGGDAGASEHDSREHRQHNGHGHARAVPRPAGHGRYGSQRSRFARGGASAGRTGGTNHGGFGSSGKKQQFRSFQRGG